jgi:hypothetical protein
MKNMIKSTVLLLALGVAALAAKAQDDGPPPQDGPPGGHKHHHPPPPLIIAALDANHDGIIDSNEIANASAALKTLDKNGDGQLTFDEIFPPRPNGSSNTNQPGPGFKGGPGGHRHPEPPIVAALDTNHDGVIDANEIANASAALKTLDKNGDGELTPDELRPPRPPRPDDMDGNRPPPSDDMGGPPDGAGGPPPQDGQGSPPPGPPGQ